MRYFEKIAGVKLPFKEIYSSSRLNSKYFPELTRHMENFDIALLHPAMKQGFSPYTTTFGKALEIKTNSKDDLHMLKMLDNWTSPENVAKAILHTNRIEFADKRINPSTIGKFFERIHRNN